MKRIQIIATLAAAFLLYLWLTGGHTWQLVPLEAIVLFLIWQTFHNPSMKRPGWIYTLSILGLALTLGALYIMPRFKLLQPSGSFVVGVTYASFETEISEHFTPDTIDKRTLFFKIWYPARTKEGDENPYLEGGKQGLTTLAKLINLPPFLFSHFANIKTHGYTNAPVADSQFPLLTFSHGYGSWFGQNTVLMEELASRGFVVVSIAHSHQTIMAARDEHTLILFDEVVPLDTLKESTAEEKRFNEFLATADTALFTKMFYAELNQSSAFTHACAITWGNDIRSALDYMLKNNEDPKSMFYHHIDSTKIGAFGMSFGGAASGEAALHDARIKAGINMDGTQYGTWAQDTMRVPFMTLEAKRSPHGYSMYAPLRQRSKSDYLNLLFVDAQHYNFTDVNLFSPIFQWLGVTGKVEGTQMTQHLNRIVPDYFTRVFGGERPVESAYVIAGQVERARF